MGDLLSVFVFVYFEFFFFRSSLFGTCYAVLERARNSKCMTLPAKWETENWSLRFLSIFLSFSVHIATSIAAKTAIYIPAVSVHFASPSHFISHDKQNKVDMNYLGFHSLRLNSNIFSSPQQFTVYFHLYRIMLVQFSIASAKIFTIATKKMALTNTTLHRHIRSWHIL